MTQSTPSWAAFALLLVALPAAAQEVTFAYRFEPGASERYRVRLNQEVSMGQMAISNMADMEVTVKCVSEADGKFSMEMKFDKVDVSMTMMGNTSASPIGEQIAGQAISFTTDANGDVGDIGPVGTFESWGMAQQLVAPVIQGWYPYLPGQTVALGGDWKKSGDKDVGADGTETQVDAAFKFKQMKKEKGRDVAVIEQALDATVGGRSSTPMGLFLVAGAGKGKGEFLFDAAKSRVVKLKSKIELTMDMTPESGGDPVETVVINQVERDLLE